MLGQLPTTLNVNGTEYKIRYDYRNILRILQCFDNDDMSDAEKVLVCLKRLYEDFKAIPDEDYEEAYEQAMRFIDFQAGANENRKPQPTVMSWTKDEQLIFPAINKVAGQEVRLLPVLHWWTFLGYYLSVDADTLFSHVVAIRAKKARGEKLDKAEKRFYEANLGLCNLFSSGNRRKDAEDFFDSMFK